MVKLEINLTSSLDAFYAMLSLHQSLEMLAPLGCALDESGYLVVDPFQKATVDPVFTCGDNTTMFQSIANVRAAGIRQVRW